MSNSIGFEEENDTACDATSKVKQSRSASSLNSSSSRRNSLERMSHDEGISSPTSSINYMSSSSTKSPPPSPPKSPRLENTKKMFKMMSITSPMGSSSESVVLSDSDERSSLELQERGTITPSRHMEINQSSDEDDTEFDSTRLRFSARKGRRKSGTDEESPSKRSIKLSRGASPARKGRRRGSSPSPHSDTNTQGKSSSTSKRYTSMPTSGKVFRNLLILEENLREQVIQQRAMRRKYLTFLSILCSIIAALSHHLFFLDNSSTGTLKVILQFCLLATIVTLMLYHLSGEYQKTIVLPRRFLSSTNQGLRQLNVRLVKIKTPFFDKLTDLIREISLAIVNFNLSVFHKLSPESIQNKNSKIEVFLVTCQSQCQPRIGVTDVKLVLNARVFNTDIREGWEMYRSEFWINEGIRRRNNMLSFISGSPVAKPVGLKRRKRKSENNDSSIKPKSIPASLSEQNLQVLSSGFEYNNDNNVDLRSETSSPLRSDTLVSD
ncbi:Spo7-like family protein [Candida albicans]|uniref:Spo7-like family protein n=1 Tax=Candida albicans TaxID=5476 RepID=A0A8H6F2S0_CANAX|nr:Spo7-like family protein [Candida albicans]